MKFRSLKNYEIDCRVQSIKQNGFILLLYKDARVDMDILDETVGAMNWQRKHSRGNANCIVSIYDSKKKIWIEKEDTGTESNTEKEKGLASDSFKRACFNWGIGRELYTAPFIWISDKSYISSGKVYEKFKVREINTIDGIIQKLIITDSKNNIVYNWENMEVLAMEQNRKKKEKYIKKILESVEEWQDDTLMKMISDFNRASLEDCTCEELIVIGKKLKEDRDNLDITK